MAVKKTEEKPKTLIYCGSSISQLQQFSIFKNSFPEYLKVHLENCPAILELSVVPEKLAETRKNISIEGTRENQLYKQTVEYGRRLK